MAEQVIPRNISMYPEDWAIVDEVRKQYGYQGRSGAVRFIIRDWARLRRRTEEDVLRAERQEARQ